jgi:nitrogen fixation NifU-like protein
MISSWEQLEELTRVETRKLYSETVIDHAMNPINVGDIEDAHGFASMTGRSCRDIMQVWLKVYNGTVADGTFMIDGCGTSIASGSMVIEMDGGKSVSEARKISQQDALIPLGGLPEKTNTVTFWQKIH